MAEARVAYRELIRAIKTHITANDGNKLWQDYVRKQFRENATDPSAKKTDKLIQLAKDCAFLINGVQEQRELLLSYNIGIDREVRQRQMIRSTAALVGFKLPYEEGEEEDGM